LTQVKLLERQTPTISAALRGGFKLAAAQSYTALTVHGWFKTTAGMPLDADDGIYGIPLRNLWSSGNGGGWIIREQRAAEGGQLEFRYGREDVSNARVVVLSNAGVYAETNERVYFALTG
jgi:hypothetical protein